MTAQPPTSVADTLRAARALIADPKHWIKGALAKPSKRSPYGVSPQDWTVTCWCSIGALIAIDGPYEEAAREVLEKAVRLRPRFQWAIVEDFNDNRSTRHADVMDAFDKAIALAEGTTS